MPAFRTDGAGGGYQVPAVQAPTGPEGDFRMLDLRALYARVMLEDDESITAAADGWNTLGQQFFVQGQRLKGLMVSLSDAWQSDAATVLADRVGDAVDSFDRWSQIAIGRSYEMLDLAAFIRGKKDLLELIWREFVHDAGVLMTPPANLTLEQRTQWREEAADADALYANLRHHTVRALDLVVNPLANRYAEAALAFAATGPVYAGPTDAGIPSDEAVFALSTGQWSPSMPSVPGGLGTPAVPARPAPPAVPDLPAAPSAAALAAALAAVWVPLAPAAPAVPPAAVRTSAPAVPQLPAGATLSSLVAAGWVVAPALAGRRAPVVPSVPAAPAVPGTPAALGVRPPGVPAVGSAPDQPGAAPAALPGRAGLPGVAGPPPSPGTPGAPGLPGGPGLPPGAAPPPPPRLPGRSATSTPSAPTSPPPPSLPGSTRPRTDVPATPGSRTAGGPPGPNRPAAPTGPHLLGRDAPTGAPTAAPPPPPALGTPRPPGEQDPQPSRPTGPPRPGLPRVDGVDPSVPLALRSARTTGNLELPDPAPARAAAADPRLSARAPSTPVTPPAETTPPAAGRSTDRSSGGRHRASDAARVRTSQPASSAQPGSSARPGASVPSADAELPQLRARPAVPNRPAQETPGAEPKRAAPAPAQELGGRTADEPTAPSRAEERAAERARRRAEWADARRRHQADLSR